MIGKKSQEKRLMHLDLGDEKKGCLLGLWLKQPGRSCVDDSFSCFDGKDGGEEQVRVGEDQRFRFGSKAWSAYEMCK